MLIVPLAIVFIVLAAFRARGPGFERVREGVVQWWLGTAESIRWWREVEARARAHEAVLKEYIAEVRQLKEGIEARMESILGHQSHPALSCPPLSSPPISFPPLSSPPLLSPPLESSTIGKPFFTWNIPSILYRMLRTMGHPIRRCALNFDQCINGLLFIVIGVFLWLHFARARTRTNRRKVALTSNNPERRDEPAAPLYPPFVIASGYFEPVPAADSADIVVSPPAVFLPYFRKPLLSVSYNRIAHDIAPCTPSQRTQSLEPYDSPNCIAYPWRASTSANSTITSSSGRQSGTPTSTAEVTGLAPAARIQAWKKGVGRRVEDARDRRA